MTVEEFPEGKRRAEAYRAGAVVIGCDPDFLRALAQVESAERFGVGGGEFPQRFEPHLMWPDRFGWRDSLAMSEAKRERLARDADAENRERRLRATSMGAFQILGRWHETLGHANAAAMRQAFMSARAAQVRGVARYIEDAGLSAAARAEDLEAFALGYNGSGQPEVYAGKLREALRRVRGRGDVLVLSRGDRGATVRDIQRRLGVQVDGRFGPETDAAVRDLQRQRGLTVDGIVGRQTWGALAGEDAGIEARNREAKGARLDVQSRIEAGVSVLSSGLAATRYGAPEWVPGALWALGIGAAVVMVGTIIYRRHILNGQKGGRQ